MDTLYAPSYYNLPVIHGAHTLLFNGVTSALVKIPNTLFADLVPFLGPDRTRDAGAGRDNWSPRHFTRSQLPASISDLFSHLVHGGYFVPAGFDELEELSERFKQATQNDPFLVTITTTLDCNLGCYYCYEDKQASYLTQEGCDAILGWIEEQIRLEGHAKLYTDWYGGEPMLNQEAIDYFSQHARALCLRYDVTYGSAMISNGTVWPEDSRSFVKRNSIRHVQFTLDGAKQSHDHRRRWILQGHESESSFDQVVDAIRALKGATRIYLRINVDRASARNVMSLIPFFAEQGWLTSDAHIYPYLAMIGPMTDHCSFLGKRDGARAFHREFDELNNEFQIALSGHVDPRYIEHLQYYPMSIRMNCAAVGSNSVVFGPDGHMFKCGLEVGDTARSHGRIPMVAEERSGRYKKRLPILEVAPTPHPWESFDPFSHRGCGGCQYLPICMGGCPKTHFESNSFYLKQQCRYWEENFDSVIRTYFDSTVGYSDIGDRSDLRVDQPVL